MENLKENRKKINELKKEIYKLKKSIDKLDEKTTFLYNNNYEEFKKNDELIKKYNKKIELNKIKIAILKNNIHYLFKMDFEGIKKKMIDYYENKKIGEKTKEKMQNEIEMYFKNNFNVKIRCYISFDNFLNSYCMCFNFAFLDDDGYRDNTLEYNEEFKINFEKRKYNDFKLNISYYNNINEYIELKNISKKASDLFKEYTKTKEKIEKLRLQQKEMYHNFTDYLQGFIYNKLEIEAKLTIY